jgi:hypothetical protein
VQQAPCFYPFYTSQVGVDSVTLKPLEAITDKADFLLSVILGIAASELAILKND